MGEENDHEESDTAAWKSGLWDDVIRVGGLTGATATDDVEGGSGHDRLLVDYSLSTDSLTWCTAHTVRLATTGRVVAQLRICSMAAQAPTS
jgi:hypothetical protein